MHFVSSDIKLLSRRVVIVFLLLTSIPFYSKGAVSVAPDSLQNEETVSTKKGNFFNKVVNFINVALEQDTTYVAPIKYNLTVMPQYTFGYEYYRFSTKNEEQSITISPTSNNKLGIYFGWRRLLVGYSFTFDNVQPEFDMELNLYASRGGIELFYRKRSDGFKIRNIKGFYENDLPLTNYNTDLNGLEVSQVGANIFYVFNYKKFSFPATFRKSTSQLKSAGSLILGVSYNEQRFIFDHKKMDPNIERLMNPDLRFKSVDYKDISINCGYSYNWVFARNFFAGMSVSPAIAYKNTSLMPSKSTSKEFISSINVDFISRLALGYNNGRYYAGAYLVSHTYSYNKTALSIHNGFGYVKIYAGFNFWQRK
ncbi:MAG: DUF4421 domain-containing protein [Bacteroidaceae bacterium]|nr:DUF4421 domain-containing protein [Bacteroidaceae bacterium]